MISDTKQVASSKTTIIITMNDDTVFSYNRGTKKVSNPDGLKPTALQQESIDAVVKTMDQIKTA